MFEQSMVLAGPANRWPVVSSVMMQVSGVGLLLLVPLIWVEQLPPIPLLPPTVFAPKPPHVKVFAEGVVRRAAPAVLEVPRPFTAPVAIPRAVPRIDDRMVGEAGPEIGPVGPPDGVLSSLLSAPGLLDGPPPPVKPKPVEVKAVAPLPRSVSVASSLQASKLIHQVKPAYPEIAKRAAVQGTVKLHAVIAQDGSVQRLQVTSGHPLLVQAAVEAVRQWRYSPTLLGGNPVEVVTQIDVNFVLAR